MSTDENKNSDKVRESTDFRLFVVKRARLCYYLDYKISDLLEFHKTHIFA